MMTKDKTESQAEKKTLQEWRNQRKLTQQQVAVLANMSVSAIADIESGRKEPGLETIEKLLAILEISFDQVLWKHRKDKKK
jgi:transcriptional regulator with XRE-family HTH domain